MGIWSTSCSQSASLLTVRNQGPASPQGRSMPSGTCGAQKHKQGPWTGPQVGADKCAEQGQMESVMEKRAPPAATSDQTRPNHVPGNFLGSLRRGTQPEKPASDVDHSLKPRPYKRQVQTKPMWTNGEFYFLGAAV